MKAAIKDANSPATLLSLMRRARNLLAECDADTRSDLSGRLERREFDLLCESAHVDCEFIVATLREHGITTVASAQQWIDESGGGLFRETLQHHELAVDFDSWLFENLRGE